MNANIVSMFSERMTPLLLAAAVVLLSYLLIKGLLDQRGLPPGPWGLPVLGSLLRLSPTEPYRSLSRLAERYGPVYSVRLGHVLTVVISDPKIAREALAKDELSGRASLFLTHGIMKGYGQYLTLHSRKKLTCRANNNDCSTRTPEIGGRGGSP